MIVWSKIIFGFSLSIFISIIILTIGESIPRTVALVLAGLLIVIMISIKFIFLSKIMQSAFFYKSLSNQTWDYTQRKFLKTQPADPVADQQFATAKNESIDQQRKFDVIRNLLGVIIALPTIALFIITLPDYKYRLQNASLDNSSSGYLIIFVPLLIIGVVLLKVISYKAFKVRWQPGKIALENRGDEKEQLAIDYRKMPLWLQVTIWLIMIGLMIISISLKMTR